MRPRATEVFRPESARESFAEPIAGYCLVAYTHDRWSTDERYVYVKACLSRPVSYWEAVDCALKICVRAPEGEADVALAFALERVRGVLADLLPVGCDERCGLSPNRGKERAIVPTERTAGPHY